MIRYKDGRFQEPQFLYLTYNTIARQAALSTGRVFVQRTNGAARPTMQELREIVNAPSSNLFNKILWFGH